MIHNKSLANRIFLQSVSSPTSAAHPRYCAETLTSHTGGLRGLVELQKDQRYLPRYSSDSLYIDVITACPGYYR